MLPEKEKREKIESPWRPSQSVLYYRCCVVKQGENNEETTNNSSVGNRLTRCLAARSRSTSVATFTAAWCYACPGSRRTHGYSSLGVDTRALEPRPISAWTVEVGGATSPRTSRTQGSVSPSPTLCSAASAAPALRTQGMAQEAPRPWP